MLSVHTSDALTVPLYETDGVPEPGAPVLRPGSNSPFGAVFGFALASALCFGTHGGRRAPEQ